jgi:peptidyl-prolyl cis-trans isomerase A (cyclophilin A)
MPRSMRTLFAPAALALAFLTTPSAMAQTVMLSTSMGDIVLRLDAAKAPKSVENFLQYVKAGHYNGTVFHRVIPGFMVQGGGFNNTLVQKPTRAPIELESGNGLKNERGTVAMARTAVPNSATSQFFINLKDNEFLNAASSRDGNGYAVFGRVVSGMDVVDRIAEAQTQSQGPHQNVPVKPITITEAVVQQ